MRKRGATRTRTGRKAGKPYRVTRYAIIPTGRNGAYMPSRPIKTLRRVSISEIAA